MTKFHETFLMAFYALFIACMVILAGGFLNAFCGVIVAEIFSAGYGLGFKAVLIANVFAFIILTLRLARKNNTAGEATLFAAYYQIIAMCAFIVYSFFCFVFAIILSEVADKMVSPTLLGVITCGLIFLIALMKVKGSDKNRPDELRPTYLPDDKDFPEPGSFGPLPFY